MCCFSGKVEEVDETSIFARMTDPGRQLLVYELSFSAKTEVAMVLPLPVPKGTGEGALRFINMKKLSSFFSQLDKLFIVPTRSKGERSFSAVQSLQVHAVGDFVASFVPSLADFTRLDPRFRMPEGTLDLVHEYADWGFAVFQLASHGQRTKVHPMAFEFPTRERERLFFPTLHVHSGWLHRTAEYSHKLYAQGGGAEDSWDRSFPDRQPSPWREEVAPLESLFLQQAEDVELMKRLVSRSQGMRQRRISGLQQNQDTWVPLAR